MLQQVLTVINLPPPPLDDDRLHWQQLPRKLLLQWRMTRGLRIGYRIMRLGDRVTIATLAADPAIFYIRVGYRRRIRHIPRLPEF